MCRFVAAVVTALALSSALALLLAPVASAEPPDYSDPGQGPGVLEFHPSQCERFPHGFDGPQLFCTRDYSVIVTYPESTYEPDASCPSGTRWFVQDVTVRETWRQFVSYEGPAPLGRWHVIGSEGPLAFEVITAGERVDQGCL